MPSLRPDYAGRLMSAHPSRYVSLHGTIVMHVTFIQLLCLYIPTDGIQIHLIYLHMNMYARISPDPHGSSAPWVTWGHRQVEIVTLWYGGRLALRGQMDFGELSSAVLVAQSAFDGARPPGAVASTMRCSRRIWRTSGFPKLQIAMQNSGWPFRFEK